MTIEQFQKQLIEEIEKAVAEFQKQIPAMERQSLDRLLLIIKDLEIRNGRILNNVANLKLIGKIKQELRDAVLSPKYVAAVKEFIAAFDVVAAIQDKYFKTNFTDRIPKQMLDQLQEQAKQSVLDHLIGRGFDANVVLELEDVLRKNITTGGSYRELAMQIQEFLVSTGKDNLTKYSKLANIANTLTIDSINQFSAQYHQIIQEDLGLQWFMYVGSNITTTRSFCEHLTKKRYIHISELPKILQGEIDGVQVKINPKTGLWYGAIEGTNAANFRTNRGGYRCGHQCIAVSELLVPLEIRKKFANK